MGDDNDRALHEPMDCHAFARLVFALQRCPELETDVLGSREVKMDDLTTMLEDDQQDVMNVMLTHPDGTRTPTSFWTISEGYLGS